jgi:hypothetical protein
MNPRRTPARIRLRHRANQRTDIGRHGRSPCAAATLPGPPESEASLVPGDDRFRLDEAERRPPSPPDTREHDPQPTVRVREPQLPRLGALQHLQLMPQRPALRAGARRANAPLFEGSGPRRRAPTSSPRSVSIGGRNINCRNENGLFSRHRCSVVSKHLRRIDPRRTGCGEPTRECADPGGRLGGDRQREWIARLRLRDRRQCSRVSFLRTTGDSVLGRHAREIGDLPNCRNLSGTVGLSSGPSPIPRKVI